MSKHNRGTEHGHFCLMQGSSAGSLCPGGSLRTSEVFRPSLQSESLSQVSDLHQNLRCPLLLPLLLTFTHITKNKCFVPQSLFWHFLSKGSNLTQEERMIYWKNHRSYLFIWGGYIIKLLCIPWFLSDFFHSASQSFHTILSL